jgi:hypothetical protein
MPRKSGDAGAETPGARAGARRDVDELEALKKRLTDMQSQLDRITGKG